MIPKYRGNIENGKLTLYQKDEFAQYLKTLTGEIELSVGKYRKSKSNEQLGWVFGVAYELISQHCDKSFDSKKEINGMMKELIGIRNITEYTNKDGKKIMTQHTKGLSEYSTAEMTVYMNLLQQWGASELGVNIPSPNEISIEDRDMFGVPDKM